ncbi:MFS transporter [Paraburkholderia sp. J63]|uniref:MFS transporter n=1 Tax=Paraburkholderia sp. J63 TaxID=2805434 RepID=UPI002ABDA176|nr:MFS transporter [Paraburkholderia sp. J63]
MKPTSAPPVASGSLTGAWTLTVFLCIAMIVSIVDRFALALVIDPIKLRFALSNTQIGQLQGLAFGMFYAVLGIPCGWLADRWSRRWTILLGLLIWGVATAACGLATSFPQLLVARMLVGAGEAALAPAGYAIIHERFPAGKRNAAISLFQVGAVIGSGSAFYVVGGLFDHLKSLGGVSLPVVGVLAAWQATFICVALPAIVLLPLLAYALRGERTVSRTAGSSPVDGSMATDGTSLKSFLASNWAFLGTLYVGMSGLLTLNYSLLSWIPTIFGREFHWTPGEIGRPYGLIVLISCAASMLVAGTLADAIQKKASYAATLKIPGVAALIAFPVLGLFFMAQTPVAVLASTALLHALCTCAVGVAPALIQSRTPAQLRSRVSAIYVLLVNICGLSIAPLLVGFAVDQLPAGGAALRMAVTLVGVLALAISAGLFSTYLLLQSRRSQVPQALDRNLSQSDTQ